MGWKRSEFNEAAQCELRKKDTKNPSEERG